MPIDLSVSYIIVKKYILHDIYRTSVTAVTAPNFKKKTARRSCYTCVRCKHAILSDLKVVLGTVPYASAKPNPIHTTRSKLRIKCCLLYDQIWNISDFMGVQNFDRYCLMMYSSSFFSFQQTDPPIYYDFPYFDFDSIF